MMIGDHTVTVQPLATCQPLAHRVLKRIQVACPLKGVECGWKGDYGDLQQHLLSQTAHVSESSHAMAVGKDITPMQVDDQVSVSSDDLRKKKELVESFKEEANARFTSGHYAEAHKLYGKAISILERERAAERLDHDAKRLLAILYANRAASFSALGQYSEAVREATQAIELDPLYVKAYVRKAKALVLGGDFEQAFVVTSKGLEQVPDAAPLKKEKDNVARIMQLYQSGTEQLKMNEFAAAKSSFGQLLASSLAENVRLGAAKADLGMGLTDSALRFTRQVLKNNPQSAEGYKVHALACVLIGELDSGIKLLRESMRLDPDSTETRNLLKEAVKLKEHIADARNQEFHRKFDEAVTSLTEAIKVCPLLPPKAPLFAILHSDRAKAYLRLKNYEAALKDCALVIYHRDDCVDAWLNRFEALHGLERHQEALAEATELMQKWGTNEARIRKAYDKADFEVRKLARPDFYKMLNISPVASEREIRKAYRQKSLELHPDRMVDAKYSEEDRQAAEKEFKLLGQGLEVLTDDFKRKLYDEGYDLEAIEERVAMAQRAAHMDRSHFHGHGP